MYIIIISHITGIEALCLNLSSFNGTINGKQLELVQYVLIAATVAGICITGSEDIYCNLGYYQMSTVIGQQEFPFKLVLP